MRRFFSRIASIRAVSRSRSTAISLAAASVSVLQDAGQAGGFQRLAGGYTGCAADAAEAAEADGPLGGIVGVSVERLEFSALG